MNESPALSLEQSFQHILTTRMQGLPIINENLQVQAIGFNRWEINWLGVLITPWFMNLVLIPLADQPWQQLTVGSKVPINLPAKTYTGLVNEIEPIGRYLTYSVHSPMFGFLDQAHAVEIAEQFLAEIMQTPTNSVSAEQVELENYLNKQSLFDTKPPDSASKAIDATSYALAQPIKRRDLLLGAFKALS